MRIAFFEIEDWEIPILKEHFGENDIRFESTPVEKETTSLDTIEILSVFIYSELTKEILSLMPNLKLIVTRSTGFDHIDTEYCKEKGITVSNVPEYGTRTVAEHTFALLLSLSRKIIPSVERTRKNNFSLEGLRGFDLYKKTLGVIGAGHIGQAVIEIANGFGMDVLVYSRKQNMELAQKLGFMYVDLNHLLTTSDVVTLHVPYTDETHHMINKENILKFKKGSILLNTARGGIIETEAILLGLEQGILKGAGIDVLEEEYMVKEERQLLTAQYLKESDLKTQLLNHVLLTKDDVLVTAHNAFNSNEALKRILDVTVEDITAFLQNEPINIV